MADGRVFVSGGSAVNNAATGVAYTTEIFDPATSSWTTGPTATRMRLYHSTSLLLPDATVITMGGGTPGPETNLNAEIYYPPYLFDAAGNPAVRPTITSATAVADPGTTLTIESPDAGAIARVALVKLGSVTHSVDMDQRFLDLPFTTTGTTVQADAARQHQPHPTRSLHDLRHQRRRRAVHGQDRADQRRRGDPAAADDDHDDGTDRRRPRPPRTTDHDDHDHDAADDDHDDDRRRRPRRRATTTTTTTAPTTTTTTTPPTTTTTTAPPNPVNLLMNGGFETNDGRRGARQPRQSSPVGRARRRSSRSGAVTGLPGCRGLVARRARSSGQATTDSTRP